MRYDRKNYTDQVVEIYETLFPGGNNNTELVTKSMLTLDLLLQKVYADGFEVGLSFWTPA